jgi:hypothetical protein
MNADIHLEYRAGSSQGKHEGEPSLGLCDRLNRTRDNSQRQLPTDHDYAVPTREYQTDQSSLKLLRLLLALSSGKEKQRQRQKQPHCCADLTRSLHIRPSHSLSTLAICRELSWSGSSDPRIPGYPHTTLFFVRGSIVRKPWKLRTFRVFRIITCCFPKGSVA